MLLHEPSDPAQIGRIRPEGAREGHYLSAAAVLRHLYALFSIDRESCVCACVRVRVIIHTFCVGGGWLTHHNSMVHLVKSKQATVEGKIRLRSGPLLA